jgi:hypothetical protein
MSAKFNSEIAVIEFATQMVCADAGLHASFGLTATARAPNVPPRGRPSRSQGLSLCSLR